jgi:hypothetical protein
MLRSSPELRCGWGRTDGRRWTDKILSLGGVGACDITQKNAFGFVFTNHIDTGTCLVLRKSMFVRCPFERHPHLLVHVLTVGEAQLDFFLSQNPHPKVQPYLGFSPHIRFLCFGEVRRADSILHPWLKDRGVGVITAFRVSRFLRASKQSHSLFRFRDLVVGDGRQPCVFYYWHPVAVQSGRGALAGTYHPMSTFPRPCRA